MKILFPQPQPQTAAIFEEGFDPAKLRSGIHPFYNVVSASFKIFQLKQMLGFEASSLDCH